MRCSKCDATVRPGPGVIERIRHNEPTYRHRICPRRTTHSTSAIKRTFSGESKCRACDKKFNTLPSRISDPRRGKFCSRKCWLDWHKAKKVKLSCHQCHRKFERSLPLHTHHRAKRKDKRAFCSRECLKAWRASADYPVRRHPEAHVGYSRKPHKKWSDEGFVAEPNCAVCGERGEAADHIVSVSVILQLGIPAERAYVPQNRMTLCRSHHGFKTGADGRLFEGDVLGFAARLRTGGWPMDRVILATEFYGLVLGLQDKKQPPTQDTGDSTDGNPPGS